MMKSRKSKKITKKKMLYKINMVKTKKEIMRMTIIKKNQNKSLRLSKFNLKRRRKTRKRRRMKKKTKMFNKNNITIIMIINEKDILYIYYKKELYGTLCI